MEDEYLSTEHLLLAISDEKMGDAGRILRSNGVTHDELEEVFHFSGGNVEVIASDLPGDSKRERTAQSYLLEGFRAFLETGEAKFSDDAAMQLTRRFGAFDVNNHSGSRGEDERS